MNKWMEKYNTVICIITTCFSVFLSMILLFRHLIANISYDINCFCIQGKRTEYLRPTEQEIMVIVSILKTVWSFDLSIHKRLKAILARLQHPTHGKQNDQSTGMEQTMMIIPWLVAVHIFIYVLVMDAPKIVSGMKCKPVMWCWQDGKRLNYCKN